MKDSRNRTAFLFLFLAGLLCYGGPYITRLGFYSDDWITLSTFHFAGPGLRSGMAAIVKADPAQWFRPLDIFLWTSLYGLFGLNPLPYHLLLLSVNVLLAFSFYLLLRTFRAAHGAALLGALLLLAYPSKDSTLYWPLDIINPLSLLLASFAYLAQLRFVAGGSRAAFLASTASLLLSVAAYDQCVFLPLLWLLTPDGLGRRIPERAWIGFVGATGTVALFLAYKFLAVPAFLGVPFGKTILLSPARAVEVYWTGLNACFGPKMAAHTLITAVNALRGQPMIAAMALILPWAALCGPDSGLAREQETAAGPALPLLGAALFVLGYLPVALSDYMPTAFTHQNRINLVPVAGVAVAAVALLLRGRPPARSRALACALVSIALAAQVGNAGYWAESYRRQLAIRDIILRDLDAWPHDTTLVLRLPKRYVQGKSPIFAAYWEFMGAIRIWTGDPRCRAMVLGPAASFGPGGLSEFGMAPVPAESLRLLDAGRGVIERRDASYFQEITAAAAAGN